MAWGVPEPTYMQNTGYVNYDSYNEALRKKYEADVWKAKQPFILQAQGYRQAQKLKQEYQTAYNEAKAANEARYQEILAGYKTRYSTAMEHLGTSRTAITGKLASTREQVLSGLKGLGEEELASIGRRYTKERASTAQQLISSGLHSTTVAPAVQAGVTRREGYAMGEARERLRREKLGYISQLGAQELQALKELSAQELMMQTGLTKEQLDFMERRQDEYPSESLYVQLMKGLGSS